MSTLELKAQEATYKIHFTNENHFSIECSCKGKDGAYTRPEYKNTNDEFEFVAIRPRPASRISATKFKYTFYLNEVLVINELLNFHRVENKDDPLVIKCGDCSHEFNLTYEFYKDLKNKIIEANKKGIIN